MLRPAIQSLFSNASSRTLLPIMGLVFMHLVFTIAANSSFKIAAGYTEWRPFLLWQVIGNLTGFGTAIMLTLLLRQLPLSVAFPLVTGIGIIGVNLVASHWFFGEPISLQRWLGTGLVIVGIYFLSK